MNKSFISLTFSAGVICILSFALAQSVSAEALYDVWKKHSQRQPYSGYSNNSAPIDPALAAPTKSTPSRKQPSPTPTNKAETKIEPTTTIPPTPTVTEKENSSASASTSTGTDSTTTPAVTPPPPLIDSTSSTESTPSTTPPPAVLEETVDTIVTPEEVITVEETAPSDENGLPNILNPFPPQANDDEPEFYTDEIQILRTPENTPEALQELLEEERRLREMNSLDDAVITPDYEEILSQ